MTTFCIAFYESPLSELPQADLLYVQTFNDESSLYSPPSIQLQAIKNILVKTSVIESILKSLYFKAFTSLNRNTYSKLISTSCLTLSDFLLEKSSGKNQLLFT
jgi:hypothetical protein